MNLEINKNTDIITFANYKLTPGTVSYQLLVRLNNVSCNAPCEIPHQYFKTPSHFGWWTLHFKACEPLPSGRDVGFSDTDFITILQGRQI